MTLARLAALFVVATYLVGQSDPGALIESTRAQVLSDLQKLPKYTCVQTVNRARYEFVNNVPGRCVIDPRMARPLAWMDRYKLDVTISENAEIFSWAGARRFEAEDAQDIVGGGLTGTGDFGQFLLTVFGKTGPRFTYLRTERVEGRELAAYRFEVPFAASTYEIRVGPKVETGGVVEYEGKIWVDPKTGALVRMSIEVPNPPAKTEICRLDTTIDYSHVKIGDASVLLPSLTVLQLWDADGARLENRTTYSSCRAFGSESVFRADADEASDGAAPARVMSVGAALPAGLGVKILLRSKIDGETSFAGDAIEGEVVEAVLGRNKKVLIPVGALVEGRVVQLEQHFQPATYWSVGLRFQSVVVGGTESPVKLQLVTKNKAEQILNGAEERRAGVGVFLVRRARLVSDRSFVSEWKTAR